MQASRTLSPTSFQNSPSSPERARVHAPLHWLQAVPPLTTKLTIPAQKRRCQVLNLATRVKPVPRVKIPNIPWRVSFYSFDLRERRHVHVFRERMECKVWIENGIEVAWNRDFAESEIHDILR